jgi:hypothetical protein
MRRSIASLLGLTVLASCYSPNDPVLIDGNTNGSDDVDASTSVSMSTTGHTGSTGSAAETAIPEPSSSEPGDAGGTTASETTTTHGASTDGSSSGAASAGGLEESSTGPTPIDDDGPYGDCSSDENCPGVGPLGCLDSPTHSVCAPLCGDLIDCPDVDGPTPPMCISHLGACLIFCEVDEDCPAGLVCGMEAGSAVVCAWPS